ncbi:MAG: hypothetical protein KF693_10975 [Nitrospira sp.]|nr:hypothetical protein [Nitrospira sp.]
MPFAVLRGIEKRQCNREMGGLPKVQIEKSPGREKLDDVKGEIFIDDQAVRMFHPSLQR